MKKIFLLLLYLAFTLNNCINAQQSSQIKRNNLKIMTGVEQLPIGENSLKVIYRKYKYKENFGDFIKSERVIDLIIYEYNSDGQIIHFVDYDWYNRKEADIQYKYDKDNFLVEEFDLIKNHPLCKYKNDNYGKIVIKTCYNSEGREEYKTIFQHDGLGRIIKKIANHGSVLSFYKYDTGNIVEEITTSSSKKRVINNKYLLNNMVEQKNILYDGNGEFLWRYNGGYKHFIFENTNNINKNWISRDTYSVSDGDVNDKKIIEFTERVFY